MSAYDQWKRELADWRIDDDILASAPEWPYSLAPEHFHVQRRDRVNVPTTLRAREALPFGGVVLDVGCGGGAASLPLVPPAGRVIGVDQRMPMLMEFRSAAAKRRVRVSVVLGTWPGVEGIVDRAHIVVCAHVAYDVPDLGPFVEALAAHAQRRVILELTAVHPWVPLRPLWQAVHGQDRPTGPSCERAMEVLAEFGITADIEKWRRAPRQPPLAREDLVAMTRRRLCLPKERDADIDALLGPQPDLSVEDMATIWWDV